MKRAEVSPEDEPKKKCPRVTMKNPLDSLEEKAREFSLDMHSYEFAKKMDEEDSLRHLRDDFCVPKMKDIPSGEFSPFLNPHFILCYPNIL